MEFSATGNHLECNHSEVTLQISVSIQPNFWEDFFEASFATTFCFKTLISLERKWLDLKLPRKSLKKLPSGGGGAGLSLAPHLSVASGFRIFGEVFFWGGLWSLGLPVFSGLDPNMAISQKIFGWIFYNSKFQSKHQPTKPNQPNPKVISLTKPTPTKDPPLAIPSPLPSKIIGQVEILDQHSVKGAERLRADEVVPNLDKVPLEDAGWHMVDVKWYWLGWITASGIQVVSVGYILSHHLPSFRNRSTAISFVFVRVFLWV